VSGSKEYLIDQMCGSDELKHTIRVYNDTTGPGKVHGKSTRIILEGHDISHLCTDIQYESNVQDVTRVELRMVGLRMR
jgi:hypothetical protein